MKPIVKTTLSFIVILMLSSCYSVKVVAPFDQKVELASKTELLPFKDQQKNWYVLWGLVPISHNSPDRLIKENGLTKVRIETKMSFLDILISAIGSYVSIVTNTTVVEGDTTKK